MLPQLRGIVAVSAFDPAAALAEHRPYLRRIAGVRFDDRLRGRVDESDLVQDALAEAAREFAFYSANPPMPLRLWLRQLLLDALTSARRRHLLADARASGREVDLSAGSFVWVEPQFHTPDPTPGSEAGRRERAESVRLAVTRLDPADREVIALRTFEGLSTTETAAVLGISPAATSKRLVRALAKLKAELKPFDPNASGP
jgi:RNA polymerase sigma-70 factor (ECF subfamily)